MPPPNVKIKVEEKGETRDMPRNRTITRITKDDEEIIVKNGLGETKRYKVIGMTKRGLYLCESESGWLECFNEFDVGKVRNEFIESLDLSIGAGKYR